MFLEFGHKSLDSEWSAKHEQIFLTNPLNPSVVINALKKISLAVRELHRLGK